MHKFFLKLPKVKAHPKKPIIGILGGIGAGKSTVANEFGKIGCAVINADKIAHGMLDEQNIKNKIVETFGDSILNSKGCIDRGRLAEIVFDDTDKLEKLNDIVHRPTMQQVERLIEQYQQSPAVKAVVLDIPLLVEVGWADRCDKLVFVEADQQIRLERAQGKATMDEREISRREKFQISLDKKRKLADNIVVNNSEFASMVEQVSEIFSCMMGDE